MYSLLLTITDCTLKKHEHTNIFNVFLASKKEYAGTNYFFCALCSHGDDGVIFGTDGDAQAYEKDPDQDHESWLKLSDIFDMFSGANCKSLVGKPKMFVIQVSIYLFIYIAILPLCCSFYSPKLQYLDYYVRTSSVLALN